MSASSPPSAVPSTKRSLLLDRRHFLGGCVSCLAAPQLLCKSAVAAPEAGVPDPIAHKFKADAQSSFEDNFKFAYAQVLIPYLNDIADEIGRKRLIKIVQTRWAPRIRPSPISPTSRNGRERRRGSGSTCSALRSSKTPPRRSRSK